jgi:ABC-type multidrug transport system permease subunit
MLPSWMRIIANNFPATWGLDVIRNIIVFNKPLSESYNAIIKLGISAIIIYLIGLYIYKISIRKFAER